MRRHPDATTVEDVMDLWLRTRPGRRGYRKIRPGGVDQRWERMAREHVDQLLERCGQSAETRGGHGGGEARPESVGDVVTYVSRGGRAVARDGREEAAEADDESEGPGPADGAWPEDWKPPPLPNAAVPDRLRAVLETVLQKSLRTLLRDSPAAPAVVVELDALCARRSVDDAAAYQRAWDLVIGRHAERTSSAHAAGTSPDVREPWRTCSPPVKCMNPTCSSLRSRGP